MRIEGRWLAGQDGIERPVFDGYLDAPTGVRLACSFLLDTGADFTVLAPDVVDQLAGIVAPIATSTTANGIGGSQQVYDIAVDLVFFAVAGQQVRISGPLPIFVTPGTIELSVLGRDFIDQFTLVYARSRNVLRLLTPPDIVSDD